ncbi:MAG: hypothetical protein N2578_04295 [Bdellovibrionaceae bacterium]|nr:hypothetical protein [Pseudobdellovibrionaceae bacterium]
MQAFNFLQSWTLPISTKNSMLVGILQYYSVSPINAQILDGLELKQSVHYDDGQAECSTYVIVPVAQLARWVQSISGNWSTTDSGMMTTTLRFTESGEDCTKTVSDFIGTHDVYVQMPILQKLILPVTPFPGYDETVAWLSPLSDGVSMRVEVQAGSLPNTVKLLFPGAALKQALANIKSSDLRLSYSVMASRVHTTMGLGHGYVTMRRK